ncbi:MAG: ATP-binding protein, partial [Lautropia sp.]
IVVVMLLGYAYFRIAGEAYALVSIGLISFAAVAQFAPAMLGGLYWKGATRLGALAGLCAGFTLWVYTLLLPSFARSGWLPLSWLQQGPWEIAWLKPEQLLGLSGFDNLSHSMFWSLLANAGAFLVVSLARAPSGQEASQALLFVDIFERADAPPPVFWRGRASVSDLLRLCARYLGAEPAQALIGSYLRTRAPGAVDPGLADARLVQLVETQLAGAVGSASARVLVASVVEEVPLALADVMQMLDETSQLRAYSRELEIKSRALERATGELRVANQALRGLDRMKDDFMSSMTHELRTPLAAIRAVTELMRDDPVMDVEQREVFLGIVVTETERLARLVNQVLDMAKFESGHADWQDDEVDMRELLSQAAKTTEAMFAERGAAVHLHLPAAWAGRSLRADRDRLLQVLMNLLANAAKFVPDKGGRVDLRLSTDDAGVLVEVQDNGRGVPPEEQERIFEKFQQGGDSADRPRGTGLGLPISRRIVEHFGGRLWLSSEPGRGACFGFFLPWSGAAAGIRARGA